WDRPRPIAPERWKRCRAWPRWRRREGAFSWQVLLWVVSDTRGSRRKAGKRGQQISRPVEAAMAQPRTGKAGCAGLCQQAVDVALVLRSGCAGERKRGRPQV